MNPRNRVYFNLQNDASSDLIIKVMGFISANMYIVRNYFVYLHIEKG